MIYTNTNTLCIYLHVEYMVLGCFVNLPFCQVVFELLMEAKWSRIGAKLVSRVDNHYAEGYVKMIKR